MNKNERNIKLNLFENQIRGRASAEKAQVGFGSKLAVRVLISGNPQCYALDLTTSCPPAFLTSDLYLLTPDLLTFQAPKEVRRRGSQRPLSRMRPQIPQGGRPKNPRDDGAQQEGRRRKLYETGLST